VFENCIPKSIVTNQQPAQDQKPETQQNELVTG
jgi:hypothetical protein